jgi:hypothetical protein
MTIAIVPMTIVVLLGEPTSPPCINLEQWSVQTTQGAQIAAGWRMTYDVDAKVLVVYPVQPGRVFCDGFEPNGEYQPTPLTRMERKQ